MTIAEARRIINEYEYKSVITDDEEFLLREPAKVSFQYRNAVYEVEAVREDGGVSIRFEDDWYRDIDEFFAKATIAGERIPVQYRRLHNFKVVM